MSGFTGDIYGRRIFLQGVTPPEANSNGSYIFADVTDQDRIKTVNSSGVVKDIVTYRTNITNTNPTINDNALNTSGNGLFEVGS